MISFEELKKNYQTSTQQLFDTPNQSVQHNQVKHGLDRDAARSRVMQPSQWHDNVLKLVASYVAKGNTDKEKSICSQEISRATATQISRLKSKFKK